MKKHISFLVIFILVASFSNAQSNFPQIPVIMDGKKIILPNDIESSNIPLPFSLVFDEATFKNKIITFYTAKNNTTEIVNAKFGSEELRKKIINNKPAYEVVIKDDQTIDLKQSTKVISSGKICFKIDESNFSPELKIGKFKEAPPQKNSNDNELHTGFIIDDALLLNALKSKRHAGSDSASIRTILRSYKIDNNDSLSKNYFLNSELDSTFNPIDDASIQSGEGLLSSAFSSIGGLDVTNIADGLAKFIIKRAKQELSIAFFKKFKDDLKKYPDLKTVFPATHNLLEAIDHEIYNYTNYLKNLRETFKADLKVIDENLPGIIDNHSAFFAQAGNFELGLALRTGCHVTASLKHDMHPGDILDTYPTSFFDGAPAADKAKLDILKGSIQSLQLFNESLKEGDTSKHSYWVGIDKMRQVVNDKAAFKIYIGLVLQIAKIKYEKVKFSSTINLYDQLNTSANVNSFDNSLDTYAAYKQYILNFGSKVNEISKMINEYEKPASDSIKVEQYAKYFKASEGLIEYCIQIGKLPIIKDLVDLQNLEIKTKIYFDIANEATDLVLAINRKNYSEIGNHVIVIYNKIVVGPAADPTAKNVVAALVKYGAFMSNLINAKNSDEVASAIESVALPVGSSRIKRETPFNVSLNAYAGFFSGHEFINGIKDKHVFNSYGVTAPIGVAISWGGKKGWSSSLFVSLLDIGAVAAYRINNDSVASVPTIQLKDIFSPGVFLSIGIPKTPISFNIGAQVGPNLRKVKDAKNDYSNKTYTRLSTSICVDIPILNLYTKQK